MSQSVAIVTGSSSGIGKARTIRLSCDFSAVVLAARSAASFAARGPTDPIPVRRANECFSTVDAQIGELLMAELPLMVFDVNETLLDLQTMEPPLSAFWAKRESHAPLVR